MMWKLMAPFFIALICMVCWFSLDTQCFANPSSLNGPMITARTACVAGKCISVIIGEDISGGGYRCASIVQGSAQFQLKGPGICHSFFPSTTLPLVNEVSIILPEKLPGGCSNCTYTGRDFGGPWPQTVCSKSRPTSSQVPNLGLVVV
eukprot:gnl/MRDRNA2_/MRDRNA2_67207_c0_seq1.p1 gnl/MRDRNA2_/MRDRNA2_67207_c0~~gnl/MRDRNA2_/MRDRNA2_67207_c0_seq1.p1  ORF type:complete len:148 (+),score=12.87 gnl/MRDRNA2_/MRDRNA2_67207_c0_seq1:113-556(+)